MMRIKVIYILTIIGVFCASTSAQKYDNIWIVGNGYWPKQTILDFSTGSLVVDTVFANMPMSRAGVSICDSYGNLELYTNSIQVHNSQYQLMQNGDSLNPGQLANDFRLVGYPLAESSIVVPHSADTNKYYLFHQSITYASDIAGFGEKLYYTLIDMGANGGLGAIEKKNYIIETDSLCKGQLEVVKHGNGKDWWLIQALGGSNGFYCYLITGDTIILNHKQYIGNNNRFTGYEHTGQAGFSSDGTLYARYDYKNDLDVFNFDRCTGLFSNPLHIVVQDSFDTVGGAFVGGGIEFSSNNRYLYVSSLYKIYQFDMQAANIPQSKTTVASYDGFVDGLSTIFGFLQLAPDGKIYGYAESTRYLHTIHNPDVGGVACNVGQHDVYIHYYNGHFLSHFPHYRTPPLAGSPCDTLTNTPRMATNKLTPTIHLYPNPANQELVVESLGGRFHSTTSFEVYNALGQIVQREQASKADFYSYTLNTSKLGNGVYILRMVDGTKEVSESFVIQRD